MSLASLAIATMLAGCSSDGEVDCPPGHTSCEVGGKTGKLACPPGGIGKADFEGVAIADQVAFYKSYNCAQPQICPDKAGQIAVYPVDPQTEPSPASFVITNCSTGGQALVIEKVIVFGDSRCFFSEVTDQDISEKSIAPGASTVIRTTYKPTTEGEDHAELRIFSNAENSPELPLRLCSTAYIEETTPEPASADGGVGVPDGGGSNAPPPLEECKAQTKLVSKCHSDPPKGSEPVGGNDAGPDA